MLTDVERAFRKFQVEPDIMTALFPEATLFNLEMNCNALFDTEFFPNSKA